MSVVVYIENTDGKLKKGTFEAVSYAHELAAGGELVGVSIGDIDDTELGRASAYGVANIVKIGGSNLNHQNVATALAAVAEEKGASSVVLSNSWMGKSAGPRVAIKLGAGIATEVVSTPQGGVVKRKAYSGKAFVNVKLTKSINVLAVSPNAFGLKENPVSANISAGSASTDGAGLSHVSYNKDTSKLSLTDAELVVSAGRGLKGPENWGMVEDLATTLGAATACSKPVSDADWRPHHEHVGQTGITISPNLYIAIGISGAIQHLAGVSSSKKIVVINTDPEAPFFKAADYGIVGDAFDVIPKLNEAIKRVKG